MKFIILILVVYALFPGGGPPKKKRRPRRVARAMKFMHKPGQYRKPMISADVEVFNN